MDTGRLGWAKATRSQVVLVKNPDSQACPRPILSLDVGPRKWGDPPISRPNQTALPHRFRTRANSLHCTCVQTDMFCSLSADFKHKDSSLSPQYGS